jgi:hypothetical protein
MDKETKPRGRAVGMKPTVEVLTRPDGSKQYAASRAVTDGELTYEWLKKLFDENPRRWSDLGELWCFLRAAAHRPSRITRSERHWLRSAAKNARTYAINHKPAALQPVIVRTDGMGGVTHAKLCDDSNPKEVYLALKSATQDRRMQNAFGNRVGGQCDQLSTDFDQLDEIIAENNARKAREKDAA